MRKAGCILIVMILLIITGCSRKEIISHNYIYQGENESWSAELKVNGTGTFTKKIGKVEYDSSSDEVFTITFKKDLSLLSAVKHLEISYETSTGSSKIASDYTDGPAREKTFTLKSGGTGGAIENKDEVIKVTINLDGEIQTINLKNIN